MDPDDNEVVQFNRNAILLSVECVLIVINGLGVQG